jgi:hypothetical protein
MLLPRKVFDSLRSLMGMRRPKKTARPRHTATCGVMSQGLTSSDKEYFVPGAATFADG